MPLYTIGDLHLSVSGEKRQDIFPGWENYIERIEKNWKKLIGDNDTVVLCGDISWAMKLEETELDFAFIDRLPGHKLIIKGNHDYWWTTKTKMDRYLAEKGFSTMEILFNNSYVCGGAAVCGTRGWSYDCAGEEDMKVLARECGRLRMSLDSAVKARENGMEPIVFLHYPPVFADYRCDEIMQVLHDYDIKRCYYGHLHSFSQSRAVTGNCEGIEMRLIAADHCNFTPVLVGR